MLSASFKKKYKKTTTKFELPTLTQKVTEGITYSLGEDNRQETKKRPERKQRKHKENAREKRIRSVAGVIMGLLMVLGQREILGQEMFWLESGSYESEYYSW